jgi:hypothetical protein
VHVESGQELRELRHRRLRGAGQPRDHAHLQCELPRIYELSKTSTKQY